MKCKDLEKYLQPYIDGEFSEAEKSEIEQHFKFCPVCQKKVSYETWFKTGFKNSISNQQAPKRLEAEIAQAIRKQRRADTPIYIKVAPVFAVLLVFLGVYIMPRIEVSPPIVEATINKHVSNLPFDVQSDDNARLGRFFEQKVKFSVRIPQFPHKHMKLMGGRVSTIQNSLAAYVAYKGNGRRYSMMVQPAKENFEDLSYDLEKTVNGQTFFIVKHSGYNVVLWINNKMMYSLASDENEDELIAIAANVKYEPNRQIVNSAPLPAMTPSPSMNGQTFPIFNNP